MNAARTRSNGFSTFRLASLAKSLVGLHMAGISTLFQALNGKTADAGGVQCRYEELSAISQGTGMKPSTLIARLLFRGSLVWR